MVIAFAGERVDALSDGGMAAEVEGCSFCGEDGAGWDERRCQRGIASCVDEERVVIDAFVFKPAEIKITMMGEVDGGSPIGGGLVA